jgi:CO/xanthine dehydrogenase Mo-binding subunit
MARYIDDIELPNMLYGKILRSRYPHAKILRINTERAWRVPGVRAVITGLDTPFNKMGVLKDQPRSNLTKLGRLGTEVAAVAAETLEAAERAIEEVEVEYQPLDGVFDPEEAMKKKHHLCMRRTEATS